MTQEDAAIRYVTRCKRAGDRRSVETMLREIVQPGLADELAAKLVWVWVV